MENLTQRRSQPEFFFQNQGYFFDFQERTGSPFPLVARQSMKKSLQSYFKCEDYFAMILFFPITLRETWYLLKIGKHIFEVKRKFL